MAIIAQHARGQGCWEEEDLPWKCSCEDLEAGGRVAANLFVRNMDLGLPRAGDNRRLEVVVDGLPLYGGAQLAVDTTLVSALKSDGEPRRGAADRDGVALAAARRDKERTYPELVGPGARARLVVLALEVGGRWSEEAKIFVRLLARARARSEPRLMRRRVEQAWRLRWYGIISCAAARSFAASLLGLRVGSSPMGMRLRLTRGIRQRPSVNECPP